MAQWWSSWMHCSSCSSHVHSQILTTTLLCLEFAAAAAVETGMLTRICDFNCDWTLWLGICDWNWQEGTSYCCYWCCFQEDSSLTVVLFVDSNTSACKIPFEYQKKHELIAKANSKKRHQSSIIKRTNKQTTKKKKKTTIQNSSKAHQTQMPTNNNKAKRLEKTLFKHKAHPCYPICQQQQQQNACSSCGDGCGLKIQVSVISCHVW